MFNIVKIIKVIKETIIGISIKTVSMVVLKLIDILNIEFVKLSKLQLSIKEKNWCITHIPYIPEVYWEWLSGFEFDYDKIKVWLDEEKHLHIEVTDYLYKVTLYEVPILAIVSELLTKQQGMINVSEARCCCTTVTNKNGAFNHYGGGRKLCFL